MLGLLSRPTVLRQIAFLLGPDISGRLRLAKEPSETRRERNCPASLSRLSVQPVRPAFRPGFLIVSLDEVVVAPAVGGGEHVCDVNKTTRTIACIQTCGLLHIYCNPMVQINDRHSSNYT